MVNRTVFTWQQKNEQTQLIAREFGKMKPSLGPQPRWNKLLEETKSYDQLPFQPNIPREYDANVNKQLSVQDDKNLLSEQEKKVTMSQQLNDNLIQIIEKAEANFRQKMSEGLFESSHSPKQGFRQQTSVNLAEPKTLTFENSLSEQQSETHLRSHTKFLNVQNSVTIDPIQSIQSEPISEWIPKVQESPPVSKSKVQIDFVIHETEKPPSPNFAQNEGNLYESPQGYHAPHPESIISLHSNAVGDSYENVHKTHLLNGSRISYDNEKEITHQVYESNRINPLKFEELNQDHSVSNDQTWTSKPDKYLYLKNSPEPLKKIQYPGERTPIRQSTYYQNPLEIFPRYPGQSVKSFDKTSVILLILFLIAAFQLPLVTGLVSGRRRRRSLPDKVGIASSG